MSVTVGLVKKIVLQLIGGKPIFGNPKQVFAAKKKIVVQKLGAGLIPGSLGNLLNSVTSLQNAMSSLVQNPLGALTSQVSGLAGGLLSQASSLGLNSGLINQISGAVQNFQSAAQGLLDHTNLISGITQDLDNLPDNLMSGAHIMLADADSAMDLAGALFKDDQVDAIRQSLDPSVSGGVTDLLNSLQGVTDSNQISQVVSNITSELNNHTNSLNAIVQADQTAQAKYLLKQDVLDTVQSFIPDGSSDQHNAIFDRIATDTLKTIAQEQAQQELDDEEDDGTDG